MSISSLGRWYVSRRKVEAAVRAATMAFAAMTAWHLAWPSYGQQNANPRPAGQPRLNAVNDFGLGAGAGPAGNANGNPGGGGAASADFDSLIDLITATVEQDSWMENGTGEGEIQEFAINGVYIDASGALRVGGKNATRQQTLAAVRGQGLQSNVVARRSAAGLANVAAATARETPSADANNARRASAMRYVSLPRLEAAIAARQRARAPLDPAMLTLAGLECIDYVLVYPETHDLVLAGPAGDWLPAPEGGLVSADTGRAVVRLDDLLVLLRRQRSANPGAFGCSIVPRQEGLARVQEYIAASASRPLEPGQRTAWLAGLRDSLGVQDVAYFNIDPDTRVASVLLAADFHMKLVGMGLAPGVPGVKSYLATVRLGKNGQAPPMNILRWWFSMPASTVEASPEHDAFAMPQRCVQVQSENELLAARGERVHTGQSDELTKQFADSFTKEFDALVDKYPVYGQLERVFELALALAVIEREGLTESAGWTPTLLVSSDRLRLPKAQAPRVVETVINHKVIGGRKIIAGISGGVSVDGAKSLIVANAEGSTAGKMVSVRKAPAIAPGLPQTAADAQPTHEIAWWWD